MYVLSLWAKTEHCTYATGIGCIESDLAAFG